MHFSIRTAKKQFCLILAVILFASAPAAHVSAAAKTPLRKNGRLQVKGSRLVNNKGKSVVLKGVSTHGINWFPEYVNPSAFHTLRDNWGVNCIRLAMYTAVYNGYCSGGNK